MLWLSHKMAHKIHYNYNHQSLHKYHHCILNTAHMITVKNKNCRNNNPPVSNISCSIVMRRIIVPLYCSFTANQIRHLLYSVYLNVPFHAEYSCTRIFPFFSFIFHQLTKKSIQDKSIQPILRNPATWHPPVKPFASNFTLLLC